MSGQSVTGAAGYDAEGYRRVAYGSCYLVDGTIASYGHNNIGAIVDRLPRQLGGMTGIARVDNVVAEAFAVDGACYEPRKVGLTSRARDGIDDEEQMQSLLC